MIPEREIFAKKVCYTLLVFERVNKKLQLQLTVEEIKSLVQDIINDPKTAIIKNGKNFYLRNTAAELVINSYNYRLITANKNKVQKSK